MRMGLDVHKKLSYYSMVNGEGTEMRSEVADEHPRHRIYSKIKARRGEKVAIVATARHMAELVYWVLTRKGYYSKGGVDG